MIDELFDMETNENSLDEEYYDEDEEVDLSEEIDLEEILNELGLEEGIDEEEKKDYSTQEDDPNYKPKKEGRYFDLDLLLEKINALSLEEDNDPEVIFEIEDDLNETDQPSPTSPLHKPCPPESCVKPKVWNKKKCKCECKGGQKGCKSGYSWSSSKCKCVLSSGNTSPAEESYSSKDEIKESLIATKRELTKTRAILETVKYELNEVNLLNSKLLYVNRIFKANNLDEEQKLRVVETLDKAESTKEAKLIYETIKGTFNIKNVNPKKSIREGLGMASSAAGMSTAKRPILNESNDMVTRMQKLANIKIKQ